ncbi:MAG: hypothetical protein ACK4UN_06840 [Limisphaerales bacterium]
MSSPLAKSFSEILDLRDQLGSPIRHLVQSPLPPSQVDEIFDNLSLQAPKVILDLYAICNGFHRKDNVRFISDMSLLSLQDASDAFARWHPILLEHGYPLLFPITEDEFGAGYGILLSSDDPDPPVLSMPLQTGVDQFFDSVELMFATLTAWLRAGVRSAYDSDCAEMDMERYRAIARDLILNHASRKVEHAVAMKRASMSLDHDAYLILKNRNRWLALAWRIGDVGYYCGLLGAIFGPILAMVSHFFR